MEDDFTRYKKPSFHSQGAARLPFFLKSVANLNSLLAYSVKLSLSDPRIRLFLFNAFVPGEVSIQVVPLLILSKLQMPEVNYHHVF